MVDYVDFKTGIPISVDSSGKFNFPTTGANMLLKPRPPIAKEVTAD